MRLPSLQRRGKLCAGCDYALSRREAARSINTLWAAIGRLIDILTPAECANMFAAAGYDPE
jgi:hypothetical protein